MKLIKKLLVVLGLLVCGFANSEPSYVTSNATAMQLQIDGDKVCSATAIGPHAFLTAEHCVDNIKLLSIENNPVKIIKIDNDGDDHSIVVVDYTFKSWAKFREHRPTVGDQVYIFGNPGAFHDLLRVGIISGYTQYEGDISPKNPEATLYDFNGFYGDSGSAIFNQEGKIVGVVSFMLHRDFDGSEFKMMGSLPMLFDPNVIKEDTK